MTVLQYVIFSGPIFLGLFGVCIGLFELSRIRRRRRLQEARVTFDRENSRRHP